MTVQQIIKQTENFTVEEKQELGYYFLFSTIDRNKKNNIMQLFHYNSDFNTSNHKSEENIDDIYNSVVAKQFLKGYSKEDNIYNSL